MNLSHLPTAVALVLLVLLPLGAAPAFWPQPERAGQHRAQPDPGPSEEVRRDTLRY